MRRNFTPYQLQPNLPLIQHHLCLPSGVTELGHIHDFSVEGHTWSFLRYQQKLIVLRHTRQEFGKDVQYRYLQQEFPLEFLSWFPIALAQYEQRPSVINENQVAGELLTLHERDVAREYCVVRNYSRCQHGCDPVSQFVPQETIIAHHFIYQGGLLALIKEMAKQYAPRLSLDKGGLW